ncbi:unnamed protein product [Closterium sp. NIES-53]
MAAQELRWLTYLLTDLGEQPRSPPVLYVDNKAMLALCREHRLEHRTKHIALRYFLARELQQRGQLRLAYVAFQANTADIFTKALPLGDHQRFSCFALLDWSCFPTCTQPIASSFIPVSSQRQLQQLRMGNQQRSVEDRPSNDDIVLSLKNQPTTTNRSPRKKSVALKQLKRELEVNMKLRRPQTSSTDASATFETSTVSTPSMNSTTSSRTTSSTTTTKNHGNRERQDQPSATPGENIELWEMPYDPINETINGYNEQRQPLLLEVICNGRRLQALVDSGASHSVCDKATLERINEKYTPSNFIATMVDGSKLQVYGEAALHLQMGPLRWKPTLPVTNIKGLDLILGRDFLKKFNPEINWVTRTASIYNQDRRVPLPNWSNTGDIPEETLARFEKDVKQTMAGFVALVTNEDEGERKTLELPPAIQKLLEEFEDVLPDDLPDHPTELADMKKQIEYLLDKGLIRPSTSPYGARARGARVVEGMAGAAAEAVEEAEGVAVEVGVVPVVGDSVAAVEVVEAAAEVVEAAAAVVEAAAAVAEVAVAVVLVEVQQLREWYAGRGRSGGAGPCTYVLRTGSRRGETCRLSHTVQRCVGRLTDAWRAQFPDAVELPRWGDLLWQNVAIFDLDFDAILAAMYALTDSAEGDCYLSVPPDPGIGAAALGASVSAAPGTGESATLGAGESALPDTARTEALHTFTLDSGASRSFFRDSTTLTPLSLPVAVSLADPSGGPVLAHSSTDLPCPAAPSGLLSGLHLPSFSTNLVSGADLQDALVDHFAPGGLCLYTQATASPPVSASCQVAASSQVFAATSMSSPASAPCSCRPLSHETLLWHHRLGHPSLPQSPLQTLHMDVWGPARVRGQGHERYFLLVVDDYSRYTIVFPLRSKGEVPEVLIDWIRGARRQLNERFGSDLHVLRLHSDRGGEFSFDLLRAFCRAEGICQTFTLPASPQQNWIAEHRIGMVMDVARTSMIHAAAPHFLWPFAVQYAAHQINLQPRVSLPETTPTLRWTGKVGDASAFRDVTFDESVSYYRLFPYRTASLPPPATLPSTTYSSDPAEPVEVAVDCGAARGAEPAGAGSGGAEPGV